jgi:hypothetical protein
MIVKVFAGYFGVWYSSLKLESLLSSLLLLLLRSEDIAGSGLLGGSCTVTVDDDVVGLGNLVCCD